MRKLLLVIILAIPLFARSQPRGDTISKLPAEGYLLKKGWKFYTGDDSRFAAPGFNDANWAPTDPTLPFKQLAGADTRQIRWFRLKLYIDSALRNKIIAFSIRHPGASEIYFNGVLLKKYGKVSASNEQTYDPRLQPLTVQLGNQPVQTLAIRYSFSSDGWYTDPARSALTVYVNNPDNAWKVFTTRLGRYAHRSFVFGVFIILTLLHFAIYIAFKSRKLNLYLAFFTFLQALTFVDGITTQWNNLFVYEAFRLSFVLVAPPTFVFLLYMVYDLFGHPKTIWLKALAFLALPVMVQGLVNTKETILALFGVAISIEVLRVTILALKAKKNGALLFLVGQTTAFVFFCAFNFLPFFIQLPYTVRLFLVDLAFLPPAVVISILLAREFAQNNISLQLQLEQVEQLSAKNLQQEQEKQQMLESQNETLERQVTERTRELNQSLSELKATQNQLIQSEKMASLGELTAGIAHEIQNPLNFVNNFSEVSIELLEELKEEAEAGHTQEVVAIAGDLSQNLQKINQHGKRADGIVKGMLQHSRAGSGERQLTDINQLADEFLKLAYHGLRAKDKDFNAELVTNFNDAVPKVNIVQQDIGRVLLNLFNNAFYAVKEKKKTAGPDYKPTVVVHTFAPPSGGWGASVKDNGNGIPDAIKDKLMQPFFTTKPTGQGTGLGLSLSYDIVVKGHGGSLTVQSTEGSGAEFVVMIPENKI